jgi:ethanolamine ammonia-lyase small subunit
MTDTKRDLVTLDVWSALRRHTPARIGLGRAGVSLPTAELLRFGTAHAQARDAVHRPLDVNALTDELSGDGWPVLRAESAAVDRTTYLMRPDFGRRLSDASLTALQTTDLTSRDLLFVVADGLSSLAVNSHAATLLRHLRDTAPPAWTLGPVVVATQSRVALGDEIGEALKVRMVVVLIGERPGLSSPDSLGAYLTWAPKRGRHDAERNCVSNIRPEGLTAERAAAKLWWLLTEAQRLGATGITLKDHSDAVRLPANAADPGS